MQCSFPCDNSPSTSFLHRRRAPGIVAKKQAAIGNFDAHLAHSGGLVKNINDDLWALDKLIVKPNAVNGELSADDIHLFLLLRNLTVIARINWPSQIAHYRVNMARQIQVNPLSSMAI
ncbi:MAG: glutaredoxin [Proteobacteria bacterium]|nr:glutaredoxin [Pseudomonadota bacterium]